MTPEQTERSKIIHIHAEKNVAAINESMSGEQWKDVGRRVNALTRNNPPRPVQDRIEALWKLADEAYASTAGNVACKRGCSHCCHIAVGMLEPEAQLIGRLIKRKPAAARGRDGFDGFEFGYDNPCTFLKDGECSIYEHRPLACRIHFNVDVDNLMCQLTPPYTAPVPNLNTAAFNMAYVAIANTRGKPKMADLRDYFPRGAE